jgi:hypothetical protein
MAISYIPISHTGYLPILEYLRARVLTMVGIMSCLVVIGSLYIRC